MVYTGFDVRLNGENLKAIFLISTNGGADREVSRSAAFDVMSELRNAEDRTSCDTLSLAIHRYDISGNLAS